MVDSDLEAALRGAGVVPVVELPNPALAVPLADTLLAAGLGVLEITFRASNAAEAISAVSSQRPDVVVGAGTVLTVAQADAALDAGANFLVAPGTDAGIVDHVLARGGLMIPGVATPSEVSANLARGIRLQKLFPAGQVGGIAYLRALRGPFRDVIFVPTGGVSAGNLAEYLREPNVIACGGTWIAPRRLLEAHDFPEIARLARNAVALVRSVRNGPDGRVPSEAMIEGRAS